MNNKDLSKPVAWTDKEEINDVARGLGGFMFEGGSIEGGDYPIYSREYVQSLLGRIAQLEMRQTVAWRHDNGPLGPAITLSPNVARNWVERGFKVTALVEGITHND